MKDQFEKPCKLYEKLNRFSLSTECRIEFSNGDYINSCVEYLKRDPFVIDRLNEFVVEHYSERHQGIYFNELLCSIEEKPVLRIKV